MDTRIGRIIAGIALMLLTHGVWGQAGSTKVTVKVVAYYQGLEETGWANETTNNWRWKFWYKGAGTPYCLKKDAKEPDWWYDEHTITSEAEEKRIPGFNTNYPPLFITMESWEEDKEGDCSYDDGDDTHYGPNSTVSTYDLYQKQAPGNLSNKADKREAYTYNYHNKVTYEFFYTPPTPDEPGIYDTLVCVNNSITLSSNTYINPKFHDQVRMYWEYWIDGDYISGTYPNWRSLGYTIASENGGNKTIKLNDLTGLTNLSDRKYVHFRVRSWANDTYGAYSTEKIIQVDPPGPDFTVTAMQASCSAVGTGEVSISVTGNGAETYRYLIYKAGDQDPPSGNFSGSSHPISGLEPGTYNILLSNYRDGKAILSKCDITRTVTIGTVAPIQWNDTNTKSTNPTCPGGKGSIAVEIDGGNSNKPINFSVTGGYSFTQDGTSYDKGIFTDLPAGKYTVTAYDSCNNTTLSRSFTLTEPPKIVAAVTSANPTCADPDNGHIQVSVSDGPDRYDYELWKGGTKLVSKVNTTATSYTFKGLTSGDQYVVKVYDAARRNCAPFEKKNISIKITPLSLSLGSKEDIKCAGGSATIKLAGSGGSGKYNYTLTHSSGEYTQNNTTGTFTVNQGGTYTAKVVNQLACNDVATIPEIHMIAPAPLSVNVDQQNISCSGNTGGLTATVTGGTEPYTYKWQEREGENAPWFNFGGAGRGTHEITKLYDARYRLIVTDHNGCQITTAEYILTDPEELSIDEVFIEHILCRDDNNGRIIPTASGGWGEYIYQYRKEGETGYTNFSEETLFAPGTYHIQVNDREGCTIPYGEPLTITEPEEALQLQYALSDYGGYQVSCFGGTNGRIDATATGGNGPPFGNQYLFALNEGAFSAESQFSGLPAGTYLLKVKDERGCIVSQSVTLSSPAELTLLTADKNYIQCFGDSTGYIRIQAEGGVPPYRYRMDSADWQDNPAFEQLPAGNYSFTVADAQGCETALSETLTTNDPLKISFSKTDVRCYGENNGEITAAITGGKAPYNLAWHEISSTDAHIKTLSPAWYMLTVTDADACSLTDSIRIQEPEAALLTTPVASPVRCFGERNGQIALPTDGGTLPYRYSLNGGATFQSDSLFTDLAPGTYSTLTVDNKGCEFISEATILEPELLELSLNAKTDILCYGEASGTIEVMATGGTQPYRYSLDGRDWQETSTFTGLTAGDYRVWLQDAHGCEANLETSLLQPEAPLQLTYQVSPVQCKGTASGAITTSVSGGTPPYSYQWQNLKDTTASVSNLVQGDYVLTITDSHGCQLTDTIVVTEPEIALQGTVSVQKNVSCFGLSDGYVQVEARGGYPPYQYAWQGETFSDVPAYEQLPEGNYQMVIRDAMDCLVKVAIYISQPEVMKATPDVIQHVSCYGGSDARFQAQVTGGTEPYRYSLDAGATWQLEAIFADYPIGSYTILVEDVQGCRVSTQLEITEPPLLSATIENVVESACAQANGGAHVMVRGGTLPYRYAWINRQGETTSEEPHPTNLGANIYDVYVTDANNCQIHLTQIINDLDGPSSRITDWQNAHCYTSSDGSATVVAEGGTGAYQYLWSDSLSQTGTTAINLARGEYFVTVTDERGCISISSVTIGSPEPLQLGTLHWQDPGCFAACDGQLELAVKGGVAPYTYRWENRSETIPVLNNLCRGDYTLTVTDAAGCTLSQVLTMTPPDALQLAVVTTRTPVCFQGCDGQAEVAVFGGTAPYRYSWNDKIEQTTPQADNLCPGTYTVTVTDGQGCSVAQQVTIEETPRINVSLPDTVNLCLNQQVLLNASIPMGQYQWKRNGIPYSTDAAITVEQAGNYQVEVTNEHGCRETAMTQVFSYDTLFEVNFLQSTELYAGDTLTLTEVSFPQPDSMHWSYSAGARTLNFSLWEPQITFEEAGSYQVTLVGYYSVCADSITKTVTFFPPREDLPSNARLALGPQGIKMVSIYPNPTHGRFQVEVILYSVTPLFVFLHDNSGLELTRDQQQGSDTYSFDFDISQYAAGQYYLQLITQHDKKVARILLR